MSTYVHLVCLDHNPPLVAADESGQHLSDLPRIRREIADREALAALWAISAIAYGWDGDPDAYFRAHSARFLHAHRTCRIGIRDEYGVEYPTTEDRP